MIPKTMTPGAIPPANAASRINAANRVVGGVAQTFHASQANGNSASGATLGRTSRATDIASPAPRLPIAPSIPRSQKQVAAAAAAGTSDIGKTAMNSTTGLVAINQLVIQPTS